MVISLINMTDNIATDEPRRYFSMQKIWLILLEEVVDRHLVDFFHFKFNDYAPTHESITYTRIYTA